ncbi:MAG TPA: Ig-like domain-containing protein [Vicinamibacterales bacterium]|nr:Ig-like domain-containing protein [Vicinamibacterales bacterium]
MSEHSVRHGSSWLAAGAARVAVQRRRRQRATILLLSIIVGAPMAACGGEDGTPAGPSDPPASVTGLSMSPGTTLLKTNQTETFTASAMMSSGPSQPVQPAWRSNNPTVLSIDSAGLARGIMNGAATITATHGGVSETRRVRVVTDYQGAWAGEYVVRTCDHSGDFRSAEFCDRSEGFWAGDRLPIGFTLTQERDAVTGAFTLGAVAGTLRGSVEESGQLTATAALTLSVDGSVITFTVPTFAARADGERLSGAFAVDVTAAGLTGQAHLDADLHSVARTGAVTALAHEDGSRSFSSWRDLLHAIKGR